MSVNDKLCRLLFFVAALRDAGAARVTVVAPYLCYARKDRRTKPRDPVTTRYVAALFEAVSAHALVTLDVHNLAAFQNAFRIPTEHLEARKIFIEHFVPRVAHHDVVVMSPDIGGIKRAEAFREAMEKRLGRAVSIAFMQKQRSEGEVHGHAMVGDVAGAAVIVLDDLISTGTTMARAAAACRLRGAARVYLAATHGVFARAAGPVLAQAPVDEVVVTNSVSIHLDASTITVLDVSGLVAEAIARMHTRGSIVDLLAP